jgi:hypothetical protein
MSGGRGICCTCFKYSSESSGTPVKILAFIVLIEEKQPYTGSLPLLFGVVAPTNVTLDCGARPALKRVSFISTNCLRGGKQRINSRSVFRSVDLTTLYIVLTTMTANKYR